MEASGAPCREERQGGAEFAGVAERDGRAGEREGARPPCGGHRNRRCAKLSKFPQAFPDAGTRAAERANSVFVRGRAQSASGQAAPCIRAACPGSTGNGGNGVCQRRRTSALRDAYAPDKADAGEERPVRIRVRLAGERGRLWCNALCSGAFVPCLSPAGARLLWLAFYSGPRLCRAAGLSENR